MDRETPCLLTALFCLQCDFADTSEGRCALCRDANEQCTFNLPLGRRGPKSKRRNSLAELAVPRRHSGSTHVTVAATTTPTSSATPYTDHHAAAASAGIAFSSTPSESPVSTWDNRSLNLDHATLSPQTVRSAVSDLSGPAGTAAVVSSSLSARHRWNLLASALARRNFNTERVVSRCLDLFFEYLFPLTPLVHEPSLRDSLAFFLSQTVSPPSSRLDVTASSTPLSETPLPRTSGGVHDAWSGSLRSSVSDATGTFLQHWPDAAFTLITAVCAEAAFLLPKDIFPDGQAVADVFLQASRNCLNSYLEADLESPNANSIAIRYFHSNCVHAAGKQKYSWHIFGEATRLAQVMQLHDESSLQGLYPIEAELRRRLFWIVYMGDKSAAILNNRPITIHKFSFATGISTAYPTGFDEGSGSSVISGSEASRGSYIDGFNANLRLWQAASDLLLDIRLMESEHTASGSPKPLADGANRERLDNLYIRFITCLDELPRHLQTHNSAEAANLCKEAVDSNHHIIQCANLQVSMHCLRMVITQKFEDIAYFVPGIEQADLRKTEIARDMLRVIHQAPFWSLQVNGEPYVEKIRLIGASLLEIIHRHGGSPLAARARGDFSVLLDILTRLDSKASDALRDNSTWIV
ncbi:hypothetical protein S40285_05737 [Stachybotrys chlorohalonatus IBT 40285]|uniref:Xylanolytic transcriptional activator regulatory domain-containing protein n=1 Tax=Stachybotrys chlorohalonatus (strain IBT 40285) TaxID=1283841 RepID=A0A084QSM0_STAC4|nr:hypothetical protein S40285_05737 [Stachybotrys chlorohalonata IBT 40285]